MMRIGLILALTVLVFVGCAGAAAADQVFVHGDLVCDRKAAIAVARFTTSYNEERPVYRSLPAAVDGLSGNPGSDRTDCRLPDGRTVRLRIGEEQAFGYGAGGGAPPSFFSLWIDRRKVLSKRVWLEGYDKAHEHLPTLVGLVIRPERLTFCYETEGSAGVSCHDDRLTLNSVASDRVEYGGPRPKPGTILLGPASRNPALCRRYLKTLGDSFEGLIRGQDDHTPFAPAIAWDYLGFAEGARVTSTQIAFAPSALPLRVVAFSGLSHFFDGDIYVVTPLNVSPTDVEAFWKAGNDPESISTRPHPAGWQIIAGGLPDLYPQVQARYVHLHPQQIGGQFYVLANPARRNNRPTAVLLRVTPQTKAEPACVFQRVEPNF